MVTMKHLPAPFLTGLAVGIFAAHHDRLMPALAKEWPLVAVLVGAAAWNARSAWRHRAAKEWYDYETRSREGLADFAKRISEFPQPTYSAAEREEQP